jgi:tetratricopeptide (TPR) repeat protein
MAHEIPPAILSAITEGRAILFLGAGASYDALEKGVPVRITADTIKELLSDKWLGGGYKNRTLMAVADFARNEASLLDVQASIRELFKDLEPNDFHLLVPTFRWKAIVTTNYDLVVERAYERAKRPLQRLAPVFKDGTQLQDALTQQDSVPYLKLHGCINNYTDTQVPIVLDSQEYLKFSQGRVGLVTALREWAINSPIIFCGYSLSDENIKQILFDIGDASQTRPQYMYISPGLKEIEARYWSSRRIAPYSGTYTEFLSDVDSSISTSNRALSFALSGSALSISRWIPSHEKPSPALIRYLSEEIVHVTPEAPASSKPSPAAFFAGLDVTFDPIYAGLDVRRQLVDQLLGSVILDTLKSTLPKFFLIRGYAGCGKSVLARRVAIEAANLLDAPLVVYLPEGAVLRADLILELQRLVKARLYVVLDDLLEFHDSLPAFLDRLRAQSAAVTVLANSRTNEFNAFGTTLSKFITKDFEIGDLEETEIDELLARLSANRLLGPLGNYDESERSSLIDKFYGRQLLVALHEITGGRPFEDIIIDEFEKITSRDAQQLYLDICTLHQCRVGVRAGLISRISGLAIEKLKEYLAGPLSNVVRSSYDYRYRDLVFRSRHEEIARMVFGLGIQSQDQRAYQLRRILSKIDLDYSSDNRAFFELLKGRRLADEFESKKLALDIFDAAEEANPPKSYIHHQRAIVELNHSAGNLDVARDLLQQAEIEVKEEGHGDASIQHTKANLLRKRANSSRSAVERERFRAEARGILRSQLGHRWNSYPEVLFGQILLDEIKEVFDSNAASTAESSSDPHVRLVNELSSHLDRTLRDRPADEAVLVLKADFLKALGKSPHAIAMLEKHCKKNQASPLIIRVLAETLLQAERTADAIAVLRQALVASPGDRAINLVMAKAQIAQGEAANEQSILGHLRRAFSDGDSNYEARLLFARCNLLYGDLGRGRAEFDSLRRMYLDSGTKFMVMDGSGRARRYVGRIAMKHYGYGFISSNDLRFDVHFQQSRLNSELWEQIDKGSRVSFLLSFNFRGPVPVAIERL